MATIVFSVPHTGSRFLWAYLNHLKVIFRHLHCNTAAEADLNYEAGSQLVIPMRDPLLCFMSHCSRSPASPPTVVLDRVIDHWIILGRQEKNFDHAYFRLDASDHQGEFKKIADFVSATYVPFEWQVVGAARDRPSDYALWDKMATDHWGNTLSGKIMNKLAPFREKYGY